MIQRLVSNARAIVTAVACVGLMAGCVYYNGMYNANRLASSARKAERDGRTFEANNLWGQVATKAESVLVRHPRSKYAEEASILRGLALAKLGQCEQALGPLSRVSVANLKADLREDAWLATGRCQVTLGNIAAAEAAFAQVAQTRSSARNREARFQRARTLRALGRYEEAVTLLEGSRESRALPELVLSLAGAGRLPESMALADSLIARGDTTAPWDTLVVTLGRQNPLTASALVDRLRRLRRTPETQARWLLDDGLRLTGRDTARARMRFREAVKVGGAGNAAGRANLELVRLDLHRVSRPEELGPVAQALGAVSQKHRTVVQDAGQLQATVKRVGISYDSVRAGSPEGDLRLFLLAEAARDSLEAPRLAHGIFLRILNEWPDSPYAPKAVLAAQQLDPEWADSGRVLLETRYLDSPYLAMIRGEEGSAYRSLEDSLSAFAATATAPSRRAGPRPGRPGIQPSDDPNDDAPGRRRPQPAPTVRTPQP
jgi:tetratricopeptide (TPR) repeat protein